MRQYLLTRVATVVAVLFFGATLVRADDNGNEQVTRVYRVFDLVSSMPQYPYEGLQLNGVSGSGKNFRESGLGGGMSGGMGGGGMGGMGGGMGGGFFQIEDTLHQAGGGFGGGGGGMGGGGMGGGGLGGGGSFASNNGPTPTRSTSFRFSADDLIESIVSTVEPDTWDDVGGNGTLQYLGGLLVVSQTDEVHSKIDRLLTMIRENSNATTSVEIKAYWVPVGKEADIQLESKASNARVVAREWLNKIVGEKGAQGQITCLDGQTVHLVAGNFRSAVTSFVPVVGSNDTIERSSQYAIQSRNGQHLASQAHDSARDDVSPPTLPEGVLAQLGGQGSSNATAQDFTEPNSKVGYQPQTTSVNMGALLQVTPALIPKSELIILDVRSIVTTSHPNGSSMTQIANAGSVENINIVAQQFMTTISMPINKPVVIGGATIEPLSTTDAGAQRLYLVVEATPR